MSKYDYDTQVSQTATGFSGDSTVKSKSRKPSKYLATPVGKLRNHGLYGGPHIPMAGKDSQLVCASASSECYLEMNRGYRCAKHI